jgi:serine/threonine protein kinase
MISFLTCREKRRQLVRELTTLFQLLRQKAPPDLAMADQSPRNACDPGSRKPSDASNGSVSTMLFNKPPQDYIVDFYDAFSAVDEGGVGLMIEYMDGGSLQDIVDSGGCDDEGSLASIARQTLIGLNYLHSKNHLHRDLKPGKFYICSLSPSFDSYRHFVENYS